MDERPFTQQLRDLIGQYNDGELSPTNDLIRQIIKSLLLIEHYGGYSELAPIRIAVDKQALTLRAEYPIRGIRSKIDLKNISISKL